VQFGGITRPAYLDFVPEASVGDYVMVHVGFAISRLNAEEAGRTYKLLVANAVVDFCPTARAGRFHQLSEGEPRILPIKYMATGPSYTGVSAPVATGADLADFSGLFLNSFFCVCRLLQPLDLRSQAA
jgi:hydrogenase assembly chaperone HypC/HupF